MPASIAIRLGVEGGAEVKRALDDAGRAGQAAFQGVGAAADAAGAATDRQVAKFQRLAQAAREAEAQARAQANVNALLGVGAGSAGSARDSASAFEDALARQDQVEAARRAQAAQNAQASLNQVLGIREAQVGAARASAGAFEEAYRQEAEALKRTADLRTAAIRNASTGWRDLSAAGTLALANIEASRRLGSLGVGPQAANENARLRPDQVQNLLYQGGDVLAQVGSGSPLGMIAFQQGPQIAQTFAGPGGASVKGALAQAGEAAAGLATRIGVVGGAIGALAVTAGVGIAALVSYRASQREVEQQLMGVGRASGVTLAQINALADAQARAAGLSRGTAREIAVGFAGTGAIGPEMIGALIGSTRDFAKVTGQDATAAAKDLATAFADPARGAEELNRRLGFLNATTQETVRRLMDQGDRLGAQRALFTAYRDSIAGAAEATQGWSRVTENLSNWWDHLGRSVSKGLFGGTLDQELVTATERLERAQAAAEGGIGLFSSRDVERARAEVQRLQGQVDERDRRAEQAQSAQRSLAFAGLVASLSPGQEALKRLEDQAARLRRDLAEPLKVQIDATAFAQAESALDRLARQIRAMREDMERYGTTATASMVRSAEFGNRTVGFTQTGQSAAEIERRYQDLLREKGLDPTLSAASVVTDYTRRLSDPNLDANEGRSLVAAREAALASAREREGLQRARDLELDALRRQSAIGESAGGGAFSRLTSTLQSQVQAAAEQFGRAPASIIAAIIEKESSGRVGTGFSRSLGENGQPSSAYGLGQITRGAERDIRDNRLPGFDRMDPGQQVQGVGAYLDILIQRRNGDVAAAVGDYFGSESATKRAGYTADVLRRAGQMGDASTLGQVRDIDANSRALQVANDNLRANTDLYGRNGLQLDAQTRANQMLSEQLARGVPLTDALRNSILQFADQSATAAQKLKLVQFAGDSAFDREQLGRSQVDQSAYARARAVVGDTTSPAAQMVIETSRMNDNLRETRSLATDAFGGMLTSLRQGATFMDAMSNAAAPRLVARRCAQPAAISASTW